MPVRMNFEELEGVEYEVDENGCWLWLKQTVGKGYGRKWTGHPEGIVAHVWYFQAAGGEIPNGYQIDHLCRVKRCVNPAHLEAVSGTENRRRASVVTEEQVRKIRREGLRPCEAARLCGVTIQAGWKIVHRKSWIGVE